MTESEELEHTQAARAAREALVGKTIAGRYVLRGLLGHGGMGAVYEAEHLGLGKRVAIKFVDPEFATDEQVIARFAREARAMSTIESAHIVTVFDAGTEDGRPYLVMELLRGEDLGQRLRRLRRVAVPEAMHIVAQVLKGLARAHAAGIVHRDLKPDNVFLVKHDTDPVFAKIVDFGISKIERPRANTSPLALTGRGTVLGTPFYMSPEQAQASSDVDARADLYSVGAILFECLTGRPPHTGESYEQIILSICMSDAPPVHLYDADIPENVSAFVARALARQREQRFGSAERMLAALHAVAPPERTRVPLDPSSEQTLVSAEAKPGDATVLDSAGPRSSRPSDQVGAATRFGVGSLDPMRGTAVEPPKENVRETRREGPKRPERVSSSAGDATIGVGVRPPSVPSAPPPSMPPTSVPPVAAPRPPRSSAPSAPPRPIGAAIITAVVATFLGIGVTFGIISVLDKKERPVTATPSTSISPVVPPTVSASVSAAPATSSSAASSASPSVAPSASVRSPVRPLPKPTSGKPLDLNRSMD